MEEARQYAAEVLVILQYLHSQSVIHRDIKPENLLIADDGHLKLCDFGSTKIMQDPSHMARASPRLEPSVRRPVTPLGGSLLALSHQRAERGDGVWGGQVHGADDADNADTHGKRRSTFVGTAEYMAPEVLEGGVLTQTVDFWGWACVLFQMLVGKPPFRGETEYLTFQKTINCEMRDMPQDMDADARDLILKVLVKEPDQRLGAGDTGHDDLRAHPFFHDVDWDHVFDQQVRPGFWCRILRLSRLALGSSALVLLCATFRFFFPRTEPVSLSFMIAGAYHRASSRRGCGRGGRRERRERRGAAGVLRGSGGCPQAGWVGFRRAQPRGGAVASRCGELAATCQRHRSMGGTVASI